MTKKIDLSLRVDRIKVSPTLAIAALAEELQAKGQPIINLSVGEPDFDTPNHIKEAAFVAMQQGQTKYTAVDGIRALKEAIAEKFRKDNDLGYELKQIVVSCGAKHSFYNLFAALINPGDEILIPAPYWVSYYDMALLVDGHPVVIETNFEDHFKLTPEKLERAITNKSRLLILNSPSNPTGLVYSKAELKALSDVLLKHPQVLVVCDDIYEKTLWNHLPFSNILNVCPDLYDRTIVINGVSKTYAMTGWRIGYAAGPQNVIAAMKKAQSQMTSSPTSISQYAALAALTGDQQAVKTMCEAYHERHDFVLGELTNMPGVHALPSDGTFYTFPSIKALLNKNPSIHDDLTFAEYLLKEAEIAVIPGSAFGAPGHIRISYATSKENLKEGMKRMSDGIKNLIG